MNCCWKQRDFLLLWIHVHNFPCLFRAVYWNQPQCFLRHCSWRCVDFRRCRNVKKIFTKRSLPVTHFYQYVLRLLPIECIILTVRVIKAFMGSRGTAPLVELDTRWRWIVKFTPRTLYPLRKNPGTHWIGGWVGPRAGLDVFNRRKTPLPDSKHRSSRS